MRRRLTATLLLAVLATALFVGAQSGDARPPVAVPKGFFGITPQTEVTPEEAAYMKAGGIESVRVPFVWSSIQFTRNGPYDWSSVDASVEVAARAGLEVLPSLGSPPRWVTRKATTMPIDTGQQRSAWTAFVRAAVKRYGPGGQFWKEHATEGVNYEPALTPVPLRTWQVWNESNFFYFAYPVSAARYARLVKLTSQTIKGAKPGSKVILSGLFGRPTASGKRGIPAATFLEQLYLVPGLKKYFDGVSLHPYAVDSETLEEIVEEFHQVSVKFHDRPGLYITEIGWGSQNNFKHDAFEQGSKGQVRQLRLSYEYLLANQRRLNLKAVYWFSWKDAQGLCDFCDSVGLFHEGKEFNPKPAWSAFVRLTGGSLRP